jgi:hypothetical protein
MAREKLLGLRPSFGAKSKKKALFVKIVALSIGSWTKDKM